MRQGCRSRCTTVGVSATVMEVRVSRRALHGFDPARLKELRGEKGALSLRSRTSFRGFVQHHPQMGNRKLGPGSDLLARVAEVLGVDVDALAVIQTPRCRSRAGAPRRASHRRKWRPRSTCRPRPTRDSNGANARSPTVTPPPWQAFSGSSRSKSDPRGCARTNAPAARAAKPDNTAPPTDSDPPPSGGPRSPSPETTQGSYGSRPVCESTHFVNSPNVLNVTLTDR